MHAIDSALCIVMGVANVDPTDLQSILTWLKDDLFVEANPIPVKWAVAQMGLIDDGIRLPLTPLSSQYHDLVQEAMKLAEIDSV